MRHYHDKFDFKEGLNLHALWHEFWVLHVCHVTARHLESECNVISGIFSLPAGELAEVALRPLDQQVLSKERSDNVFL